MEKNRFPLLLTVMLVLLCLIGGTVLASSSPRANTPLTITQQPASITAPIGEKATVRVAASGEGLTYKWYYRNADSSGFVYTGSFRSNTYTVEMDASRDGRQVYCVISDRSGKSVRTDTVTLQMGQPLQIPMLPSVVEVASGKTAAVTVDAAGDGLSYHWFYKDLGSPVFKYTSTFKGANYKITMDASRNGRQVYCVIGDRHGNTIRTNTVTLSMKKKAASVPSDGIYDVGVDALPYSELEIYDQLFDLDNKVEVDIDMSKKELQKLQDDYTKYLEMDSQSPIYRKGTLTVRITTKDGTTTYRIAEVGVRMKGNTSRTDFYSKEKGIYNHIHFKLDFQETFDDEDYYGSDAKVWNSKDARKARKDRTFAAMEKLDLRWNKNGDSTYLKETYAYSVYRSEGVIAPMSTPCSLDWSGLHMGVYTINEPVDELFLEKRLPESELGGDLYKCGQASFTGIWSIGIEDEDQALFYSYDLKTNKKTSDHSTLKNFIYEMNNGTMTKKRFAQMVDMEQFLYYAATSYFLGNPDDLRNNVNNFYIYFTKESGKLLVIPHDLDRCLGTVHGWDPTGHGSTLDDPFSDIMSVGGYVQADPLYRYSIIKGGWYVEEFAQILQDVSKNELLDPDSFTAAYQKVSKMYRSDAQPTRRMDNAYARSYDFALDNGYGGNLSFRAYMKAKMETFNSSMADLDTVLTYAHKADRTYYIRGTMNSWKVANAQRMHYDGNVFYLDLRLDQKTSLKVYDKRLDQWYGTKFVSPITKVSYGNAKDNGDLVLSAGYYRIAISPVTKAISITKL